MRRSLLACLLCLCMVLALLPAAAFAADTVNLVTLTMDEPAAGNTPATTATLQANASTYVKSMTWAGELDDDGKFLKGNAYTVTVVLGIRDGINRTFKTTKGSLLTINGKEATIVSETAEELALSYKFTLAGGASSNTAINKVGIAMPAYTQAEADKYNSVTSPITLIRNTANAPDAPAVGVGVKQWNASNLKGDLDTQQWNQITRVLIDLPELDNTHGMRVAFNTSFGFTMRNLQELWLSNQVNAETFINDMMSDTRYDPTFTYKSGGFDSWEMTIMVPASKYPNGYNSMNLTYQPKFRLKIYDGDLYAAFEKGAEAGSRDWCTQHSFTHRRCTPDRQMQIRSCQQGSLYYYSCEHCGKCEYNKNHSFSYNPLTKVYGGSDKISHSFVQKLCTDAAYIGVDAAGYKVYWRSCLNCGAPYNALNSISALVQKNALENATQYEKPSTFRVANKTVAAKMSVWAQNDVNWANLNNILDAALLGSDYTKAISRLQFCSVAVGLAEELTGKAITAAPASTFSDTQNEYVLKAYAAGITSGTSDTTFSPDATLNRQQMAAFLYRALQYVKDNSDLRYTSYTSKLASYSDKGQVASWATEPMAFMNALGLITGTTATTLAPGNNCTIEQALVVANRSLDAHQIGWYQCIAATEKGNGNYVGGNNLKQFCASYAFTSEGVINQASYVGGNRIWVTGPRGGGALLSQSHYPTTDPYNGQKVYVLAENWKPIREK